MPKRTILSFLALLALLPTGGCLKRFDLYPVGPQPGSEPASWCQRDDQGNLLIRVANRGNRVAHATTTIVEFQGGWPIHLPTPPIAPGQVTQFRVKPFYGCPAECRFQIVADFLNEIVETDENNNRAAGLCR